MTTRPLCAVSAYSTKQVVLFTLGFLIVSVLALSLVATSSASSERPTSVDNRSSNPTKLTTDPAKKPEKQDQVIKSLNFINGPAVSPALLLLPQDPAETVETYAADCTTPKQTFSVGEVACAKATGTLVGPRVLYWVDFQGELAQVDVITSGTPSASRPLTGAGNWKVYLSSGLDGTLRATARFGVSDPQQPSVDLAIFNFIASGSSFTDNGFIKYQVTALNKGPDRAAAVQLTHNVPNNAAFVSSSQDSGTTFNCTNNSLNTTCTLGSLASGDSATFTFIYQVTSGTPVGTSVSTTANITASTEESHTPDNSSSISARVVSDGSGATCTLDCPNNIVVSANTSQGSTLGANVVLPATEAFGDCGTVTSSVPSGSFFPVGSTTVVVTSSTGGGSCSFVVTVVEDAAPSISCPANVQVPTTGCDPVTVNVGTPTPSPSGVSVVGERSDGLALDATYPAGITTITWTATDAQNRTAFCTQTINVDSDDTTAPTIVAPPDVNSSTPLDLVGLCGVVIGETQLGTANATDNCSVNISRTGVPAGNFFPVGTTVITYTATDAAGNTATATQNVIVADGPPVIFAPADASYVCPSEVPAGHPSQATGPDIIDANGNPQPGPPADSCSSVVVTVADSTTGAGSASSPLIITRTFTATDTSGSSASAVQTITVIDDIAPTVTAPADASYDCASDVPLANASDATGSDNCATPTISVSESNNGGTGSGSSPLVITRTYTATDAAGNTASDSQTITVIDSIAPTVTAPAPVTASADAACQAAIPDFTSGSVAADNCGPVTLTQSPAAGTMVGLGTHQVTVTAVDASGNSSPSNTSFTVNDTTAPVLSCPANIVVNLPASSSAVSMPVNFPAPTATDNCSAPTVSTSVVSGSVFPVGTTTVTATATDAAGNSSSCTFTVTVLYNFTGFFPPVGNLPVLNSVNAGRAIPVKFSLSGDKGLNIFTPDSPYTIGINCDTSDPGVDIVETVTAGGSSLSFGGDQYTYVWKTNSSWAGTCRQLVVKLNDGTEHRANFKFR